MTFSRSEILRKIIVERSAPNLVTAMTWDGIDIDVYRSRDSGMTWARFHVSPPVVGSVWDIAVDPLDTNTLYTAHGRACFSGCVPDSGGVSKSIDGGRHWTALVKGTDRDQIVIDPFGSGTIYAGSEVGEWRRSTNGGATWTLLGMTGPVSIFRIALDPVDPGVLHATTTDGGIWRSDDRGDTWHKLGNPFAFFPAWSITVNPAQRARPTRRRERRSPAARTRLPSGACG